VMGVEFQVRAAVATDLESLIAIAAKKREQYQSYEPQFWRPASDAVDKQRQFFRALIKDEDVAVVVATGPRHVQGFAMARTLEAPPVYDPGGLTCLVDDFAVDDDSDWPKVGPLLLQALAGWAASRGASQVVIVTARMDGAKRQVLRDAQLSVASEWWVGRVSAE
jgi:GNAT superfamily N-acetyltransferase